MKLMKFIRWIFKIDENHHGEKWSELDRIKLTNMSYEGVDDDIIAKKLGRTKRAIQQKRCVMKL